jgi:HPt (histidine-containing phosphotransfer) domain-containing protein
MAGTRPGGQPPPARQAFPPPPDSPPDFNKAEAVEHAGGDEELLKELLSVFLSEYPPLLAQIRDAIAQRDFRRLERVAHALKGAAGTVAASAASDAAQRLEIMGRTGDLTGATLVCTELEDTLRRLRPALLVD